jgi:hypothetical protein
MRIKSVAIALICLLGLAFVMPETALANTGRKPVLALLPVIDNSCQRAGRFATEEINDRLAEKYGTGRYTVLSGQVLLNALAREGIADYRSVDNATLLGAMQRIGVDFCVKSDLQYITLKQKVSFPSILLLIKTWTAHVPLYINITEVNQGVLIYEGRLEEFGDNEALIGFANQAAAVQKALDTILPRIDSEVPGKLKLRRGSAGIISG